MTKGEKDLIWGEKQQEEAERKDTRHKSSRQSFFFKGGNFSEKSI